MKIRLHKKSFPKMKTKLVRRSFTKHHLSQQGRVAGGGGDIAPFQAYFVIRAPQNVHKTFSATRLHLQGINHFIRGRNNFFPSKHKYEVIFTSYKQTFQWRTVTEQQPWKQHLLSLARDLFNVKTIFLEVEQPKHCPSNVADGVFLEMNRMTFFARRNVLILHGNTGRKQRPE